MKSSFRISLLCALVAASFILGCNSTKKIQDFVEPVLITLTEPLSEKYIRSTYRAFQPEDLRPANRTINQYRVKFGCAAERYPELSKKLSADKNIEQFSLMSQEPPAAQNNTNSKHAKVKPIDNNNK